MKTWVRGRRTAWSVLWLLSVGLGCGRAGYSDQADPCDGVTCSEHGSCVVLDEQQALCICEEGYYADGLACIEITVVNPCAGVTCSGFGTCAVRDGLPLCVCASGYHNPPDDKANCIADEHPCDGADGSPCDDGQFCTVDDTCFAGACTGRANPCDDENSCTVDTCNELDDQCLNTPAPDDVPCDDGFYCTIGERCLLAECVGGIARVCADGNPCTEDTCDEDADSCLNQPLADGTSCEDGAFCTTGDTCNVGTCFGGSLRQCDDGNACTSDVCNESDDACENPPLVDGTPCEDGQFCTVSDTCQAGACQGSAARNCNDSNPCTADGCNENTDTCDHPAVTDGTICSDGLFCTLGESCTGGVCGGGAARDCSDGNPCTADTCDEAGDTCAHPAESDGTPCDDGQWCTLDTNCISGVCGGGTAQACDDGNGCTLDSCDEANDACVNDSGGMNGAGCDDGVLCTVGDSCSGGVCDGVPNSCDDGNPCTSDTCDLGLDVCSNAPVGDGTGCDDGLFCTDGDTCNGGVCAGTARDCSDGSVCTADSCNEVTDTCVNQAVANGTACEDGQWCTVGESCQGGTCGGGVARNCSDGNPCTTDTCDEGTSSCLNTVLGDGTPCNDGLWCTENESCQAGTCGGGSARNCSDGDACTADACNETIDACENPPVPDDTPCDDGEWCSLTSSCLGGVCTATSLRSCDDSNACTTDTCDDVANNCVSTALTDGTPCSDGQFCTLGETCTTGICGGGTARNCSDGNPCTTDTCDDGIDDCVRTPVTDGTDCEDGAYCNEGESCQAGICGGGTARNCDDGEPCTLDFCDESSDSCIHDGLPLNGTVCNDGLFCTLNDQCQDGACTGGPANTCSDSNACTADVCNEGADSCDHTPVTDGTICSDGLFCSLGESCTAGVCGGGAARDCSDGNPCTTDICDEDGNTCTHPAESNGTPCDDGQWCTLSTSCTGGMCGGGTVQTCDDFNGCTLDSCDEDANACVNDPAGMNGAGCDDGVLCTVGDSCSGGVCDGVPNSCDDGNPCTADACDTGLDVCSNVAVGDGTACEDGLYCTDGDTCSGGVCAGAARDCSDGSVCTADSCNEVTNACVNQAVANGTACEDGQWCTVGESCQGGACSGGVARNCSDGNPCTTDTCDDGADACVNTNLGDGTPCNDGLWCTENESCQAGACGGGSARDCSDGDSCTADVCNESSDVCEHPAVGDSTPCDDGEWCSLTSACLGGVCTATSLRTCDDGNACTTDVCDEVNNVCVGTALTDGTPCSDGQFCTLGETCQAGACGGGVARNCSDGNPCTTDTCDDGIDDCVNTPAGNGTSCSDGAFCTEGETCQGGVCTGGAARNCADTNPCTQDFCDESVDACIHDGAPLNGTSCEDGLFCTLSDLCLDGTCTGGAANTCSDGEVCTVDSCDEGGDVCVHDGPAANGLACSDGSFCTVNDTCSGGSCSGGTPRNCSDGNTCTLDSCDEAGDRCINDATAANGLGCDDGLFCNTGEICQGGVCTGGAPRACTDGLPCTVDSCDEDINACAFDAVAANGLACNDSLFCNVGETCLGGACQGGSANACSDGNDCTADSCDEGGDHCVNDPVPLNGTGCDDGNFCLTGETCNGGICGNGSALDCADTNPCTADSCNEGTNQCVHTAVADGAGCSDGQYCTVGETCSGGTCGGSTARNCSDGNSCTDDPCNEGTDTCDHVAVTDGTSCDDAQYCIDGESCTAGVCGGGAPRDCSDGLACTVDTCSEAGDTCLHDASAMNGVGCDDGNFCLVGETCNAGSCGGGNVRGCSDGNPCTADSCDEDGDTCVNAQLGNGTPCEAGEFCTSGDSCQSGACVEGAVDPCTGDPCASVCDEVNDACGGCAPAGTQCLNAAQEATCDGACNTVQLLICPYGCNLGRDECNECNPATVECRGDLEYLCNAEFTCDAAGLLQNKACCTTNRCACDGSACLENLCAAAPDLSQGDPVDGTTCNDDDNIPGDCYPGGSACRSVASGGAPDDLFQFTLDDGLSTSAFYTVTLDTAGSTLDTGLRVSPICGNEVAQLQTADVCGSPVGTVVYESCTQEVGGADELVLCGLPEGTYFGAVESLAGTCGAYGISYDADQVFLDTAPEAGNISSGGTFTGTTCGLADNYHFPDTVTWSGSSCADCTGHNPTDCPNCGVLAANDCTLLPNSNDDKCTYSGLSSPDAVFFLALDTPAGVDISTAGSDFDTVLYIMQTGASGASPPGARRICNDDCWSTDGPSHIQTSLPAGLYYVYLDGAGGDCGNYVLDVIISPAAACGNQLCQVPYENCRTCPLDCTCPHCGNGAIEENEGELCDDGNTTSGDGCGNKCFIEDGYYCIDEPSICGTGFAVDRTSNCACSIPDGTNTGPGAPRVDTVSVSGACTVVDIAVDMNISHTWIGDLVITLQSPEGTTVTLHNRSGDGADNIVGTYDETLPVDGPGSLYDFLGHSGTGTWTLTAQDWVRIDTGTLNSWTLHLLCL